MQILLEINITTILSIYGAVISTILFIIRYVERKELRRKLVIEVTSFVKRNYNNELIDNRRGGQYLLITISNKGKTITYVDRYFLRAYNNKIIRSPYSNFKLSNEKIDDDKPFPRKLEHGEKITLHYPLTKYRTTNGDQNMEKLREISKSNKFLEAYCCDTLSKWHHGRPLNIRQFCKHFDLMESDLTI